MNDPETYYVPAPPKERGDLEAADAMEHLKAAFECAICQEKFERTAMVV